MLFNTRVAGNIQKWGADSYEWKSYKWQFGYLIEIFFAGEGIIRLALK